MYSSDSIVLAQPQVMLHCTKACYGCGSTKQFLLVRYTNTGCHSAPPSSIQTYPTRERRLRLYHCSRVVIHSRDLFHLERQLNPLLNLKLVTIPNHISSEINFAYTNRKWLYVVSFSPSFQWRSAVLLEKLWSSFELWMLCETYYRYMSLCWTLGFQ